MRQAGDLVPHRGTRSPEVADHFYTAPDFIYGTAEDKLSTVGCDIVGSSRQQKRLCTFASAVRFPGDTKRATEHVNLDLVNCLPTEKEAMP